MLTGRKRVFKKRVQSTMLRYKATIGRQPFRFFQRLKSFRPVGWPGDWLVYASGDCRAVKGGGETTTFIKVNLFSGRNINEFSLLSGCGQPLHPRSDGPVIRKQVSWVVNVG